MRNGCRSAKKAAIVNSTIPPGRERSRYPASPMSIFLWHAPQHLETGRPEVGVFPMRYMVVIEQGPESFGAYIPDLPGCIAAGETKQEVLRLIREAIQFHLEGLKHEGGPVPQPHSYSEFVEVHP